MATTSVAITPGSGDTVRVITNAGVDSGAKQQLFTLAGPDGVVGPADPDGTLQVSPDPHGLLLDDFSATLSAAVWTTGGTTAPVASAGTLTTSAATTASATSFMRSVGGFALRSGTYLIFTGLVKLEAAALVNNSRWWGIGTNQTTPTAAAPVLNGAVFLIDYTAGALYAATYSAGTRLAFVALTRPTDAGYHKYEIRYRQSVIYWMIDGVTVATVSQPNLAVANNLPIIVGSANFTTAPTTGPSLTLSSMGISDLSGTHNTIGDGANPWLQATVKPGSTAPAASDLPLVVALHPSAAIPTGVNVIGGVGLGSTIQTAYSLVTTASTNAASIKASAGTLQNLTISNVTATAAFVKLYNKASAPTVGTDVPVITLRVAATGSVGDTVTFAPSVNGQRFSTGIAIAVTGAAAATDATATVAGIQLFGTYV